MDNVGGSMFLQSTNEEFEFAEHAKDEKVKEMRLSQWVTEERSHYCLRPKTDGCR